MKLVVADRRCAEAHVLLVPTRAHAHGGMFLLMVLSAGLSMTGCAESRPGPISSARPKLQRYGSVIGVKPEKLAYYKQLHAHPWPAVSQQIAACHIRNYSIYLRELEPGKYYLFSYFEYVGDDFDADMKKMAADPETQRWWKETDPCQTPIPLRLAGEKWSAMEEVFHQD
jgi:L-rhamnose mutarotase